MRVAIIPPLAHMDLVHKGDLAMFLAHFVRDDEGYAEFARNYMGFKLLDNSAAEDAQVTIDDLISAAKEINADEIVCHDVLFKGPETVEATKTFLLGMSNGDLKRFKWMAVPQGKNQQEWVKCYRALLEIPEITTIGLSKFSVPASFPSVQLENSYEEISCSRTFCVASLLESNLWDFKREYHLLGMGNPLELKHQPTHIRSVDSCFTILAALLGIKFDKEAGLTKPRTPTMNEYFEDKLDGISMKTALHNIEVTKRFANWQDKEVEEDV